MIQLERDIKLDIISGKYKCASGNDPVDVTTAFATANGIFLYINYFTSYIYIHPKYALGSQNGSYVNEN